jgi:hypothetical protein
MTDDSIDCKLAKFFASSGSGSCQLSTNSGAFISVWNRFNEDFGYKYRSLISCFEKNGKEIPADISMRNTFWIETLKNGGVKGIGKKFLDVLKNIAMEKGYKYVFLYPSSNLKEGSDQERLIGYYTSLGFEQISLCDFWTYDDMGGMYNAGTHNTMDSDSPFHLMFANLEHLNTRSPAFDSTTINYKQKYFKYKAKYLHLLSLTPSKNKNSL